MNANILCLGCRLIKAGTRVCCCAVPDGQGPLTASQDGAYVHLTVADWLRFAGGEERQVGQRAPANFAARFIDPWTDSLVHGCIETKKQTLMRRRVDTKMHGYVDKGNTDTQTHRHVNA